MSALRQKLTYSNISATLALVLALGGTSYAAATIDSSDIQNGAIKANDLDQGSVGSAQVIDGSLRLIDLSTTNKKTLGAGASMTNPASQTLGRSSTVAYDPATATVLGTLDLQSGAYIARASATFSGPVGGASDAQPTEIFCRFGEVGGEATIARFDLDDSISDRRSVPFEIALRPPTARVQLACNFYNPASTNAAAADQVVINAVRVASL